jgi:2,3-dihydroxybenzoate decarboxylase
MDAARVDKQVLSLWSPGVQAFDPMLGTELAHLVNDRVAEAVREHPDRFAALATIAPQAPAAAARELERAISQLGLHGAIINSHTKSEHLDDAKFWPIFEAAQALNTPIYLHPRNAPVQMYDAFTDYTMGGALWGFAMETSTHVVRLLMSGVFDQFPDLKIVLGHLGEGLPFWLDRLDSVSARPGMPTLRRRPSDLRRTSERSIRRTPKRSFRCNLGCLRPRGTRRAPGTSRPAPAPAGSDRPAALQTQRCRARTGARPHAP